MAEPYPTIAGGLQQGLLAGTTQGMQIGQMINQKEFQNKEMALKQSQFDEEKRQNDFERDFKLTIAGSSAASSLGKGSNTALKILKNTLVPFVNKYQLVGKGDFDVTEADMKNPEFMGLVDDISKRAKSKEGKDKTASEIFYIDSLEKLARYKANQGDEKGAEEILLKMVKPDTADENLGIREAGLELRKQQVDDSMAYRIQTVLNSDKNARGPMAINQTKLNNIGGAKALIDQLEGQPGGADSRQMFEVAAATARSLIGNNMLTEGEINKLIPNTYRGNVNKFIEKVSNKPTGLEAQQFVKRFAETLKREYDVTEKQLSQARQRNLGFAEDFFRRNPDRATEILGPLGIYHPKYNPNPVQGENPFANMAPAQGQGTAQPSSFPSVGGDFNGHKVLSVKRVE